MCKLRANRIPCLTAACSQIRTSRLRLQKIPLISALALMTYSHSCDWYSAKVVEVAQVS